MKARYEFRLDFVLFRKREWQSRPERWFTAEEQVTIRDSGLIAVRRERSYLAGKLYQLSTT